MAQVNKKPANEWQGAFAAAQTAYQQVQKNPKPLLLYLTVYTAATALSLLIQEKTHINEKGYVSYSDVLSLYFLVPLTAYAFALSDKKFMEISDFLTIPFRKFLMLFATTILLLLVVLGSALLLLLPVIWTLAWFMLAIYAAYDKDLTPVDALKESKRISAAHKGKVWGLVGVSFLLAILASIISMVPYIGVAALAFLSVITTAMAAQLYRWLQAAAK